MELFLRQQFELLLQEATNSFAERTVYRCGGPDQAVEVLQTDPERSEEHTSELQSH